MQTFKEVLQKAQSGDVVSIEAILDEFSSTIEHECGKFGIWQLPEWSCSDLCQEVLFRVLTKLDQFDGGQADNPRGMLESWIRVTARNVCKNIIRHRSTKTRNPEMPIREYNDVAQSFCGSRERAVSSVFVRDEEAERLQTLIKECLDEDGQLILNLRIVEGLSLKEISERLPLSYDQVRYKFDRALELLRKRLVLPS